MISALGRVGACFAIHMRHMNLIAAYHRRVVDGLSLTSSEPDAQTPDPSTVTSADVGAAVLRRMIAGYATNSVSVQLDLGLRYFVGPQASGLIGYQERAGVAVVMGDPLCAPQDTTDVVSRFLRERPRSRSRALFVSASAQFVTSASALGCGAVKVGEEAVFDLDRYSFNGGSMKRLRYHEGRARRSGVEVENIATAHLPSHVLAAAVDAVTAAWVTQHAIGPLGFLLALRPLYEPDKEGKRVFVACVDGRPIAFLTAVPLPAANGVYLEDYVRGPEVPDGTAEVLFHEACRDAQARGYSYVSLGTAPLAGLTPADSREHPLTGWLLRTAFERVSWPYDFKSLLAFKARFHPTRWVPKYLVYERPFTPRFVVALALAYGPVCPRLGSMRRADRDDARPRRRPSTSDVTEEASGARALPC